MENKIRTRQDKTNELKINLRVTDYQAIKYAEGALTATEFAPIRIQRQAWRDEINILEQQLLELREG